MTKPTKENTLCLPIKQVYFDQILAGEKKKEFREIKDSTFKKYLNIWKENGEVGIYFDDELISVEDVEKSGNDPMIWNNGVYPYDPKRYSFLDLRVGYAKDRDTALVEVKDITFEPAKTKEGKTARFNWSDQDGVIFDENGSFCVWQVVYHLGKVVKTDLKKDR